MYLLVLNSGSSSLKYELFDVIGDNFTSVTAGRIERIGEDSGDAPDHAAALAKVFGRIEQPGRSDPQRLIGIGHRIVHGGEAFDCPALIDDHTLEKIRKAIPLAPLHNPASVAAMEAARALRPDIPHVAVFDTAFHQAIPSYAHRYALPAWCYEKYGIRRYGMHGTSHAYVSRRAAELLDRPIEETNVITLHLGNGASAAAVAGGRCVETSMGLTPLEGLVMGTRSGDLDPAVPLFLCREVGMTVGEVDRLLNYKSGLKGLCGENDMRAVLNRAASGDVDAELALAIYCHSARKYVGSYAAILGRLDALVFTAGVGENAAEVRRRICENLDLLGLWLDETKNREVRRREVADVATTRSRSRIFVIPTDEEREIATQTLCVIRAHEGPQGPSADFKGAVFVSSSLPPQESLKSYPGSTGKG